MSTEEKQAFCAQQIKRLASKPFFPTAREGIQELAYVLDAATQSTDHARRVVDAAIMRKFGNEGKAEDRCPGPADLAEMCRDISANSDRREALFSCDYCHGDGFEPVVSELSESVARCRCGGVPMSDSSRLESYRRAAAAQTPAEKRAHEEWKNEVMRNTQDKKLA